MTTAFDTAALILRDLQGCDALTLQKLLYYAQGWCLAETGRACFPEAIEAWKHGPVVRAVWRETRYGNLAIKGSAEAVPSEHASIVADVVEVYGHVGSSELVESTHAEPGWLVARRGLAPDDSGDAPIDLDVVRAFFRRSTAATRKERMREALSRSRERAQLRKVLEPHRETMLRLAQ